MNGVIVCLYGCCSYNSTNQYVFALCSVQKPTSQSFHEIQRLVKNGQLDCDNPSWSPRKTGINPRTNQGWTPGFGWPFTSRNSVDCPTKSRWGVGGLHLSWEYNKGYITTYVGICHHCYTQISNIHVCWIHHPANFSWSTLPFFWVKSPNSHCCLNPQDVCWNQPLLIHSAILESPKFRLFELLKLKQALCAIYLIVPRKTIYNPSWELFIFQLPQPNGAQNGPTARSHCAFEQRRPGGQWPIWLERSPGDPRDG